MRLIKVLGTLSLFIVALVVHSAAQNAAIQYFYDDLGHLVRVVDQNGNSATYNYDSVGNILSISRSTVPANGGLAILGFSPQRGTPGQVVTIQGQGFGTTANATSVQFNGTPATITAASTTSLTVTVPVGATTGPISVATNGNSVSSDTNFTVLQSALVLLTVTPVSSNVNKTQTLQFTATGKFEDGSTQDMTSSVAWSSSNTSIATISNSAGSQGLATGVSDGYVFITATGTGVAGSTGLRVGNTLALTISPGHGSVLSGASQQFQASLILSDGSTKDVTASTSWSSSNPAVATISNSAGTQGLAATLSNGSTTISGTYGNFTSSSTLNVVALTSITVSPSNPSIPKGGTQQFTATANYTDGSAKDITNSAAWNSSNPTIARISNAVGTLGVSTAVNLGTATMTATYGGISGSTTATITGPAPTSITITPSRALLPPGGTLQLKATATLTDGSTSDLTSGVTWLSSNPSIATVSTQGLTSGIANGSVTITAGVGSVSSSVPLTVTSSQIYQGYIYAADGQTPAYGQKFFERHTARVYDSATGTLLASAPTDASGAYFASGNPPSGSTVDVQTTMSECSESTFSVTANANGGAPIVRDLILPLAVIRGNISYYDGTPAAFADVFITADESCYGDAAFNQVGSADADGNYLELAEVNPGSITISAQDGNTGLFSSRSGAVVNLSSQVNVDVQLPPTGAVSGSVFDAAGNPVSQTNVNIYTSISDFLQRQTVPSGNAYQFTQIPLGPLVITASSSANSSDTLGASTVSLAEAGQQLTLNVTLQPTGTVSGQVFAADGVTPAPATVTIENTGVAGGIADFYPNSLITSGSGNFSLTNVPIGPIRIAAIGQNNAAGVVSGVLTQNGALTLNPILGSATTASFSNLYTLTDANGFFFDLDCAGQPIHGGYAGSGNVAYDDAATPYVNRASVPYFCETNDVAALDQGGRQLIFGPRPTAGSSVNGVLQVGRKVFVPQNGGFARYLEILTNPLSTPVTATIEIQNGFFRSYDTLVADPSQNGDTFSVMEASTDPAAETLGFVLNGGAFVNTDATLSIFSGAFTYKWTVTVPANQTIIVMHFLIQRMPGDSAGATSQAQALVNLTDPNALVGMTTQEKSEVVNFNVQ